MDWRSLNRTLAAGKPVVTTPKELTATAGRAAGAHGAPGCTTASPKAHLAPCWAQTPPEGCDTGHLLLEAPQLWRVSLALRSTRSTDCPHTTSPAPHRSEETQTTIFLGSTDHLDFCSEPWNTWGRAWLGTSAVPGPGLRSSGSRLLSTGASPAPLPWPAGELQAQVTRSAGQPRLKAPSTDSLLPELSQTLPCFSGASVCARRAGTPMAAGGAGVHWEQPGMLKHPESGAGNRERAHHLHWDGSRA